MYKANDVQTAATEPTEATNKPNNFYSSSYPPNYATVMLSALIVCVLTPLTS